MDRLHTSCQNTSLGMLWVLRGMLKTIAATIGLGIAAAGVLTVLIFWSIDTLTDLSANLGKRPQAPKLSERQWQDVPRERRRAEDQVRGPGAEII